MHELFIVYLRNRMSWYWLAFFTLQGPLCALESVGRGWLKARRLPPPPPLLSIPLTLGLLLWLGDVLFFPDITRMGVPQQVVANLFAAVPKEGVAAAMRAALKLKFLHFALPI